MPMTFALSLLASPRLLRSSAAKRAVIVVVRPERYLDLWREYENWLFWLGTAVW
jgi:hypothetical protein